MKKISLSVAMLALCGAGAQAAIISDDFSANTLAYYTNPSGGREAFVYDSGNGRVNQDSTVSTNAVTAMAHNTSIGSFTGTGGNFTLTMDVLMGSVTWNNLAINPGAIGVSTTAAGWQNDGTGFEMTLRSGGSSSTGRIRLRTYDSITPATMVENVDGTTFALAASGWYRLSLDINETAANTFSITSSVTRLSDNTVLRTFAVTGITNAGLGNQDVYAGLAAGRSTTSSTIGGVAADNFIVIPEPASTILLAIVGLAMVLRRRKA